MTPLFSGTFFAALGWALFHFLWQGALVALALAILRVALARRSPAIRYVVACGALALLLVLPVATAWSIAARGTAPTPLAPSGSASAAAAGPWEPPAPDATRAALLPDSLGSRLEAFRPWALLLWFAGVLVFSLRFLGGFWTASRMTRRGTRPASEEWRARLGFLANRLAVTRPVRLLESAIVKVPTAIGALRPAILIPASVFTGLPARGIEALIAHELAHVRRHDYLVNLLQTLVETLLFYHPAVWWVSSRVRVEREECCDDLAIAATGDARSYARALVRLEEMRGAAPVLAVAAAGGNLWNRVFRLLRDRPAAPDRTSSWLAGTLGLALLGVLGAAAQLEPPASERREPERPEVSRPADAPDAPDTVVLADRDGPGDFDSDFDPDNDFEEEREGTGAEPDEASAEKTPTRVSERVLTEDERIAFRNHGVTPEFVKSIAELGYERADPETILSLRIHGATPGQIAEMNRLFGKRPLDEHVAFRIHGVTPESVRRMSELGVGKIRPDEALAFRIHGVDADFVEKLRSAGYERLSADDLVAARIHGVRPEDADGWKKLGLPRPSLEELVAARIHGADPEFAAEIRSAGLTGATLEDLVGFRIHGVTGEFLREMKAVGLELSGDEATGFRIHGVTTDFVREIQSLGYANPDPDDLVSLRIHGISAADVREENARAGQRLPLDEIIDYRNFGKDDDDDE
jgi:beta-lactamase regulating signal transducer with metallopeptidase domain